MVLLEITRLPAIVDELSADKADLFDRIFSFYIEPGYLVFPEGMVPWVREKYGDIETQQIVRVTNKQTGESALFNSIRARRPLLTPRVEAAGEVMRLTGTGPFVRPFEETPYDTFDRVEGEYWVTASNIAKYDTLHGVIILKDTSPIVTEEPFIQDLLDVAVRWCREANRAYPQAGYPFFLWNVLWRAGASTVHNHAHILLARTPYSAPAWMEQVRREYRNRYGSEYDADLSAVHTELGLGITYLNTEVMAHLTPKKEHEVVMVARTLPDLAPAIARVLECYLRMGIQSYNAAIFMPPLHEEGYYVARLVDRGDIASRTSDIGGMELYAGTPVVSSDPFRLMEHLIAVMQPG